MLKEEKMYSGKQVVLAATLNNVFKNCKLGLLYLSAITI